MRFAKVFHFEPGDLLVTKKFDEDCDGSYALQYSATFEDFNEIAITQRWEPGEQFRAFMERHFESLSETQAAEIYQKLCDTHDDAFSEGVF